MSGGETGLPGGWVWATVGEVLASGLKNGRSVQTRPGGFPVLRLTALVDDAIDLRESKPGDWSAEDANAYLVTTGDILVSRGNGTLRLVGRGALVDEVGEPVAFPDTMIRIRADLRVLDVRFAVKAWNSQAVRRQIEDRAKTTAGIYKVSQSDLEGLGLPIPPLNEQKRIVAKLDALQERSKAAKEALDAIPPLLEKLRQSVLAAAFRGDLTAGWRKQNPDAEPASALLERIRAERRRRWEEANPKKRYVEPEPVDPTGLPELPEGWCWATADELASEIIVGHVGPMKHRYVAEGVPFLRSQNVRENRFDAAGLLFIDEDFHRELRKSALAPGDLLVVRSGAPGTACVLPPEIGRANCADLVITRLLHGFAPELAAVYINSEFARSQVRDAQVGVAQQHFNVGSMKTLAVPLMSEMEQSTLLQVLSDRSDSLAALGSAVSHSRLAFASLTQSILSKAFRGELVPQDPADEPASVLLERIRAERAAAPAGGPKRGRRPPPAD